MGKQNWGNVYSTAESFASSHYNFNQSSKLKDGCHYMSSAKELGVFHVYGILMKIKGCCILSRVKRVIVSANTHENVHQKGRKKSILFMFWPFLGYKLICLHFKVEFSVFILLYLYPFLQKIVVVLSFLKEIYVYSFITKKNI